MKFLWTLLKVVLALAIAIPVGILAMAAAFGVFGMLVGLAFLALRIAVLGLILYGAFRVGMFLFGGRKARPVPPQVRELPPVDPHLAAAMRELDQELGHR